MKKDNFDFIDVPDTSPASPEVLRGRMGRLGVGETILLDGAFNTDIETEWSPEVLVTTDFICDPAYIQRADGELRLAYQLQLNTRLYERTWDGAAWSAPSGITTSEGTRPCYIELQDGEFRLAYRNGFNIVERIWNGSSWGAATDITTNNTYFPTYVQEQTGELHIIYMVLAGGYIVERIWNGSAWGEETFINEADSTLPAALCTVDGYIRCAYTRMADTYLVERIWNGSSWGDETPINEAESYSPKYVQLVTGEIRIAYRRTSDNYLVERIWNGSSWGDETPINEADSTYGTYVQQIDGEMRIAYRNASNYLVERTRTRYAQLGAGIIAEGIKSEYYADWRTYGNGDEEEEGTLTTDVVTSSNANQYADLVYLHYTRKKNKVSIVGTLRLRSTPNTTESGLVLISPPAHLAVGDELGDFSAAGLIIRQTTAGNSSFFWDGVTLNKIRTASILVSVQAGVVYTVCLQYTMRNS
jgi:hypothetical protein